MRIPPSVIIMSCVTAVPVVLAVHADLSSSEPRLVKSMNMSNTVVHEAPPDPAAGLDTLIGAARATPGPLFGAIAVGQHATYEAINATQARSTHRFAIETVAGRDNTIFELAATPVHIEPSQCDALRAKLAAAWGPPDPANHWIDREQHRRATLDLGYCTLRLTQYADAADWLALVHTELVGSSVDKALSVLGAAQDSERQTLRWFLPGLGEDGTGAAFLRLATEGEKIHSVHVMVGAGPDGARALRDLMTAQLHQKPETDDETGTHVWTWKRKLPVAIEFDGTTLTLTIGDE